jgi:hypothetical protein
MLSKYSSKTVKGGNGLKTTKGKLLIRLPHRVHVWRDNVIRIRVSVIIQLLSGSNALTKPCFGLNITAIKNHQF